LSGFFYVLNNSAVLFLGMDADSGALGTGLLQLQQLQ